MAPHLIKPNCGLKQVIKSLWKAFYKILWFARPLHSSACYAVICQETLDLAPTTGRCSCTQDGFGDTNDQLQIDFEVKRRIVCENCALDQ